MSTGNSDSTTTNIKVVCRFRPLDNKEISMGSKSCVYIPDEQEKTRTVQLTTLDGSQQTFAYDRVFDTESNQNEVYEYAAKPILDDVLQGYNGCLLAYGQTGAGKTHTMVGPTLDDDESRGIIPRVVDQLFDSAINADECMEFMVKVSFVEIYMEKIRDLLDPTKSNLQVGEDETNGVYIKGASEKYVGSAAETYDIMKEGNENRATAATGMNAGSSRSHSLFILTLIQNNREDGSKKTGKFFLVDLAGSETVNKTKVQGQQLEEAKKINQSLSALGNVIKALTESKSKHTPYRDSKLTRVLQECLGGNSRTALIINCSPSAYNEMETLSTLRFGKRAKSIKNRPVINKERSPEEMKRYITVLEKRLTNYEEREKQWIKALQTGDLPENLERLVGETIKVPDLPSSLDTGNNGASDSKSKDKILSEDDIQVGVSEEPDSASKGGKGENHTHSKKDTETSEQVSKGDDGSTKDPNTQSGEETADTGSKADTGGRSNGDAQKYKKRNQELKTLLKDVYEELKGKNKQISDLTEEVNRLKSSTKDISEENIQLLRDNYRRAMEENADLRERLNDLDEEVVHLKDKLEDKQDETILHNVADELEAYTSQYAETRQEEEKVRSVLMQEQVHDYLEQARNSLLKLEDFERVKEACFEHERNIPRQGWSGEVFPTDPPQWADEELSTWKHKDEVQLPNGAWYWLNEWSVDKDGDVDENGWQYGETFEDLQERRHNRSVPRGLKSAEDTVRRRKWIRTRVKIGLLTSSSKIGRKYTQECPPEVKEVLTEACKTILGLARRLEAQDNILAAVTVELRKRQETIRQYETRVSSLLQKMADAETSGDVNRLGVSSAAPIKIIRGQGGSQRNLKAIASPSDTNSFFPSDLSDSLTPSSFLQRIKKRFSPLKQDDKKKEMVKKFCYAAQEGNVDLLKEMLRKGEVSTSDADSEGRSAVLFAARGGKIDSLEALNFAGADFSQIDKSGRNALHYATRQGCMDATVWLLSQGFSVHTTDGHALTPLHQAALGKHSLLCELLLGKGADWTSTDTLKQHGRTPLMVARRFDDDSEESKETIKVLQSAENQART